MSTQLALLVHPRLWLIPVRAGYQEKWDQRSNQAPYEDIMRILLSWLSKLMAYTHLQQYASSEYHTNPAYEVSPSASICELAEPQEFVPSEDDPIHIPSTRQDYYLKLQGGEDHFSHVVHASDINSDTFCGFIRIFVADRPFYDPSGPPEWSAEYKALYEICGRMYEQSLSEDGYSMLHPAKVLDTNEVAELLVNSEGVIGRPTTYEIMKVRIFEEANSYSETEFSALPPPRPICKRPTSVGHLPGCKCTKVWG